MVDERFSSDLCSPSFFLFLIGGLEFHHYERQAFAKVVLVQPLFLSLSQTTLMSYFQQQTCTLFKNLKFILRENQLDLLPH